MGAAIRNVLQPRTFLRFKKTQGPLMKVLNLPGRRLMKQLAVRVHFSRCGGLLDNWENDVKRPLLAIRDAQSRCISNHLHICMTSTFMPSFDIAGQEYLELEDIQRMEHQIRYSDSRTTQPTSVFGEPTVTGAAYLEALQLWSLPQLKESEPDNFIWHQDGASPHSTRLIEDLCTRPMDFPQRAS
ncbi:hypothetical protein TNCV_770151 [Trichonephila clavipes]|nr:hypothetical protein TNCV_770151 [Trichonephila clavipes]